MKGRGPRTATTKLIKLDDTGQNQQPFKHAKSIKNWSNFLWKIPFPYYR